MRCAVAAVAGAVLFGAASGASGAILVSDPFDYADGNLNEVATPPDWGTHSGLNPQMVVSGRVLIDDGRNADHNRQFSAVTAGTLYAAADVTVNPADLPQTPTTATDGYFYHFGPPHPTLAPPNLGTEFRGRVWAVPGTVPGTARFALSTTSGVATAYTSDFDAGTPHRIVVSYDFATGNSQLWLDPATNDAIATLTGNPDSARPTGGISGIALRSGNSTQGDVFVDNVIVADTFAEAAAIPEPAALGLAGALGALMIRRRRRCPGAASC